MDYKKKMKRRILMAIGCIVLGVAVFVIANLNGIVNRTLSSMGIAIVVSGAVRVYRYRSLLSDEDMLKEQEIEEKDERNRYIDRQARSVAFMIYVVLSFVAVLVLEILHLSQISDMVAVSTCLLLVIYLICYSVIRKRS